MSQLCGSWQSSKFVDSSIHGIPDIVTSSGKLKICWLALFLVALGFSGYYIAEVITAYMEHPTVVQETHEARSEMKLPDLVVCPPSRFDPVRLENLFGNDSAKVSFYLGFMFLPEADSPEMKVQDSFPTLAAVEKASGAIVEQKLKEKSWSLLDLLREISYSCEEIVSHSTLGMLSHSIACKHFISDVGFCALIEGPEQTYVGSTSAGMRLSIRVPHVDQKRKPEVGIVFASGVKFMVYHPSSFNFNFVFAPADTETKVSLEVTEHEQIRSCNSDSSSRPVCIGDCVMNDILKQDAPCLPVVLINITGPVSSLPLCNGYQFMTLGKVMTEFLKCMDRCLPACRRSETALSLSYRKLLKTPLGPLPWFKAANDTSETGTVKETDIPNLVLSLTYVSFDITHRKEYEVMPLGSFVANIGGVLGLWIGASILGIIQFFVLMARQALTYRQNKVPVK